MINGQTKLGERAEHPNLKELFELEKRIEHIDHRLNAKIEDLTEVHDDIKEMKKDISEIKMTITLTLRILKLSAIVIGTMIPLSPYITQTLASLLTNIRGY